MPRAELERVKSDVGRRVAEARNALGWSQAELADALGFRITHQVQRIETGKLNLTLKSLVALANVLDVTPAALLEPFTAQPPPRRPGRPKQSTR